MKMMQLRVSSAASPNAGFSVTLFIYIVNLPVVLSVNLFVLTSTGFIVTLFIRTDNLFLG